MLVFTTRLIFNIPDRWVRSSSLMAGWALRGWERPYPHAPHVVPPVFGVSAVVCNPI